MYDTKIYAYEFIPSHKKRDPKVSFVVIQFLYQPMVGAVRATGVLSAAARSRGKLCNCVIVKTLYSLLLTVASKFRLSLHPYVY
jgi:hypothetical protein